MLALARPYSFVLSCLLLFVCRSHRKILSTEKLIPEYSVKDVGGGVADHLLDSHPWQESYLLFHFLQTSLFPQALGRGIFSSSFSHCYCSSQGGGRGALCVGEWVEGNDCVATGDDGHDDENKNIEDDDDDNDHCTMRRSPLQSVNRTSYQNVYLALIFSSSIISDDKYLKKIFDHFHFH